MIIQRIYHQGLNSKTKIVINNLNIDDGPETSH